MNRMMKKAVSAALSLTMIASSSAAMNVGVLKDTLMLTASAASESYTMKTIDDVVYKIYNNEDKAVVAGCSRTAYSITIPKKVKVPGTDTYKTVKSIEALSFYGKSNLYTVNIQADVSSLPDYAFYGCANLWKVILPPTLTSIPTYAFFCTAITKLHIPYKVTSVGSKAFYGCSELEELYVHRNNTNFASDAFASGSRTRKAYTYPGTARGYLSGKGWATATMRTGDIDNDGFVRAKDVQLALEEYVRVNVAHLDPTFTAEQRCWADVNCDYTFDIKDVTILNRVIESVGGDCPQNFEYLLVQYGFQ